MGFPENAGVPHVEEKYKETQAPNRTLGLLRAINVIRTIDETIPIQQVALFLEIAINEGQTLSELQARIGLASSSTSRGVYALSAHTIRGKQGLGLIDNPIDPNERRRKLHVLTAKGRRLARLMTEPLES